MSSHLPFKPFQCVSRRGQYMTYVSVGLIPVANLGSYRMDMRMRPGNAPELPELFIDLSRLLQCLFKVWKPLCCVVMVGPGERFPRFRKPCLCLAHPLLSLSEFALATLNVTSALSHLALKALKVFDGWAATNTRGCCGSRLIGELPQCPVLSFISLLHMAPGFVQAVFSGLVFLAGLFQVFA